MLIDMASNVNPAQVNQLKQFVNLCKGHPAIIHLPELSFFKDWLARFVECWCIGIILLHDCLCLSFLAPNLVARLAQLFSLY